MNSFNLLLFSAINVGRPNCNCVILLQKHVLVGSQRPEDIAAFKWPHARAMLKTPNIQGTNTQRKKAMEKPDEQCDQIGLILKGLGDKFSFKSSPNILQSFGLF